MTWYFTIQKYLVTAADLYKRVCKKAYIINQYKYNLSKMSLKNWLNTFFFIANKIKSQENGNMSSAKPVLTTGNKTLLCMCKLFLNTQADKKKNTTRKSVKSN